jgi:hypothetical protein
VADLTHLSFGLVWTGCALFGQQLFVILGTWPASAISGTTASLAGFADAAFADVAAACNLSCGVAKKVAGRLGSKVCCGLLRHRCRSALCSLELGWSRGKVQHVCHAVVFCVFVVCILMCDDLAHCVGYQRC